MRRRDFIKGAAGSMAVWPLVARAQSGDRMRRIGVLSGLGEDDPEGRARLAAFQEGLQKLGWTEGRNLRIDVRWGTTDAATMQRLASELVALQPVLIVTQNTPGTAAMLRETRVIPIVFANVVDPVGSGFVASIPRPGGNVTGFISLESTIAGKWLGLLKQI